MAQGKDLRRLSTFVSAIVVGPFLSSAFALPESGYAFPDCVNGPLANNTVCDTTKDAITRVTALIDLWTDAELVSNTVNGSPGVPRLGVPAYNWWSEGLHGVAQSVGVDFALSGNFSFATSFPQPILMGAAFDDALIEAIAAVISTEGRAFNNNGRAGLDYWTPNINPFKDPRWGRGQETPGEDPFHLQNYVYHLIVGLQGGVDPKPYLKVAADCKHYAAYNLDNWEDCQDTHHREGFNAVVTQQDLSEYYLPSFQTCVRDAKVASVMCSYNAVNGIPSCANKFLLQDVLRDHWGFGDPVQVATDALLAGTDVDCGIFFSIFLPDALARGLVSTADLKQALVRQYASLVRLGYFDPPESQPFRQLGWTDVNTPEAQQLARTAAVEGIVLLKNDGTLPFSPSVRKIALVGPWGNATTAMQGNYFGVAPFLISPFQGAQEAGFEVEFRLRGGLEAAGRADVVVFAGGLDESVEAEQLDRLTVTWPGNQLDLVAQLADVGKPLVVVQFGGGQVDDSALKANTGVNAIVWAGYPGQSGGAALFDILTGKAAPAGRLPITQYPEYVDQVPMTDMTLRPSATNPGRTYKWYTGTPVFEFGFGLHYTTFSFAWTSGAHANAFVVVVSYSIDELVAKGKKSAEFLDLAPLDTFSTRVTNTGNTTSDYVALLFVSGTFGPAPHPNKQLVAYTRVHELAPNENAVAQLNVTLGALARADESGAKWLYPGTYTLALDTTGELKRTFRLVGEAAKIADWPKDSSA
ncbi:hypothetical protein V8D89_015441 [Ganoderma adspersum]